jgi:hypothetical protein
VFNLNALLYKGLALMGNSSGSNQSGMEIGTSITIHGRAFQLLLAVSTLALSWQGMMVVHEFGHVLFAWLSGGSVARVVLSPLEFSRTDLQKDPHPMFVAWGGAVVGVVLPLLVSFAWRGLRWRGWYIWQFFAGFCLIANGLYFAVVSFIPNATDPGDLMRAGSPQWPLVLFGVITFPMGFFLWNGLGPHFGLGKGERTVDRSAAIATFACLLVLIVIELLTYAG